MVIRMTNALISPQQGDLVVQIEQTTFPVAAPLFWVACTPEVQTGFTYREGVFSPPPPPPVPAPTVIRSVTMRQARRALLQAGLLNQVDGLINALPSPQKEAALIDWEYASSVERNSELVNNLIGGLGLTENQVDDLFALAATFKD